MFGFKKKNKEQRTLSLYLLFNSSSSYASSKSLYLSTVYRCVEIISDSIAQLPLEPFRIDSKGYRIKFTSHPTYNILSKQPNLNMTKYTFIKTLVISMLLTGNAYAYIDRDENGNCIGLYYIPSEKVTVMKPLDIRDTVAYSVVGFKNVVESCNMIHLLNITLDGYEGISTLTYAAKTLGLAYDAENNAEGFFKGGANLAGILKSESPLTNKLKTELKTSWNSAFNGSDGTPNGVAVLDADLSYLPVAVNPSDAQLLETRLYNVVDICRFFGVSPVKAFDLSKSSYNTIEQMQLAFLTDTIQPLLEKIEEEFERKLYKPSEKDSIDVKFNTASLLRADKQSLANYYNTLFQIGAVTVNELRLKLDLPEIPEGDNSFVLVNVQTLSLAVNKPIENDGLLNKA